MNAHNDYLWDRSGQEDPDVKRLEKLLGRYRLVSSASPLPVVRRRSVAVWVMVPLAAAATLFIAVIGGKDAAFGPPASWNVSRVTGAPVVDSDRLSATTKVGEGDWIQTDDSSEAVISVGTIGRVQVEPNSRVQLIRMRSSDHRLALAKGTLRATIWAPPRLFFVETPSATAIDLGCAYTLTVDDLGRGRLCVTSGWVALERGGRETVVPSGAVCETRPGIGPGTPYFGGASEEFRAALARFDFEGAGHGDLETVLRVSNMCEVFTLWQLLPSVRAEDRGLIFDRMAQILPPPPGVTREGVLALDEGMLEVWGSQFTREEFMPCLTSCTASLSVDASQTHFGSVSCARTNVSYFES